MDTTPTTTTTTQPASPPTAPAGSSPARKVRAPLDAAAREKLTKKSAARRLLKKLGDVKDVEELWAKADELRGRKVEVGEPTSEPDPLDQPVAPGWPTPRQMAEVAPLVAGGVGMLKQALEGTRYDQLSVPLVVPGPEGTKITLDRAELLAKPATATLALLSGGKLPEIHPGWALLGAVAIIWGPTAAAHGLEIWRARNKSSAPSQGEASAPVPTKNEAKSSGEQQAAVKKRAA